MKLIEAEQEERYQVEPLEELGQTILTLKRRLGEPHDDLWAIMRNMCDENV